MEFELSQLWYLGGVPLVVALTQVFKAWIKETRWYPIIAIILGIILDIVVGLATGQSMAASIIVGIITGLAASGLYSGVTSIKKSGK